MSSTPNGQLNYSAAVGWMHAGTAAAPALLVTGAAECRFPSRRGRNRRPGQRRSCEIVQDRRALRADPSTDHGRPWWSAHGSMAGERSVTQTASQLAASCAVEGSSFLLTFPLTEPEQRAAGATRVVLKRRKVRRSRRLQVSSPEDAAAG